MKRKSARRIAKDINYLIQKLFKEAESIDVIEESNDQIIQVSVPEPWDGKTQGFDEFLKSAPNTAFVFSNTQEGEKTDLYYKGYDKKKRVISLSLKEPAGKTDIIIIPEDLVPDEAN